MMTDMLSVLLLVTVSILCVIAVIVMVASIAIKVERLHLAINSRLDELLRTTSILARAEGYKAGQENHLEEARRASETIKEFELKRGR
jgi:uncharacterized metal-binding protein